jgi:ubiquinone/menaquinone biosynthesis C-methylase UbiE
MVWLLLFPVLVLLSLVVYWQLIIAEGVYLGPRVVRLLYDWTAHRYDRIKGFEEVDEDYFLGRPLTVVLRGRHQPFVLDVATGTGRLLQTLLRQPGFQGQAIGLDVSGKMLDVAGRHLVEGAGAGQSGLLQATATTLPFADNRFEAVTCLEAMEFFADAARALKEMVRVLRPGGWLLISNRVGWEARLMPGHTWTRAQLIILLRQLSLTDISMRPWQVYYDLVWARKKKA